MLSVRSRRWIAAVTVTGFVAASAAFTYVATRDYSPGALRERAEGEFAAALPYKLTLGEAVVSLEDEVHFDSAAVTLDGRELLKAGEVTVTGLPRPLGPWSAASIAPTRVEVILDLGAREHVLEPVGALRALLSRVDAGRVASPEFVSVVVRYPGLAPSRYVAPTRAFFDKAALDIIPLDGEPDADFRLTASPEEVTLAATMGEKSATFVQAVSREAGDKVLGRSLNPDEGRFRASWRAAGETVAFTNASGWRISPEAIAALGIGGPGAVDARVAAFEVRDGTLVQVSGQFECAVRRIETETLSQWLGLVGLPALNRARGPRDFDNVRIAAEFDMRDGVVTVRPVAGRPGLIWCDVGGEPIVLATGMGQASLADIRKRAAQAAPAEEAGTATPEGA